MKYSFGGGLGSRSCFFLSALLSSFFPFFYEHSFVSGYMPQLLGPCNWLTQVYFGLPIVSIFFMSIQAQNPCRCCLVPDFALGVGDLIPVGRPRNRSYGALITFRSVSASVYIPVDSYVAHLNSIDLVPIYCSNGVRIAIMVLPVLLKVHLTFLTISSPSFLIVLM